MIGAVGAAIGTALGQAGSGFMRGRSGADLGAGYFGGRDGVFSPEPWAFAGIALLGIAMSGAGAPWTCRTTRGAPRGAVELRAAESREVER